MRLRQEKTELYQAAVNAWKNGEVSQALSQMKLVLDLDRRAPDVSSPDAASTYQSFYNKIRSEHDAMNNGYAEARRQLADKDFDKALEICRSFLEKYPGQALFQALKFDIDEQQRQRLSSFIADVDRRARGRGRPRRQGPASSARPPPSSPTRITSSAWSKLHRGQARPGQLHRRARASCTRAAGRSPRR